MGRSQGAAARRRKAAAARKKAIADVPRRRPRLPPELLANIHDRLRFLDRIAFAAVFSAPSCDDDLYQPYAPWLLLPGKTPETVELFSVADRRAATARAPYPALRNHVVLGSSARGWLATADHRGQIHVVNPATGEQHALPHIATMGVFLPGTQYHFTVWIKRFLTVRFGSGPPFPDNRWGAEGYGTCTFPAHRMRILFYRKVVLSPPTSQRSYGAAMLILDRNFGAPAFATAEDAAWKLAPSEGGVEDAIHHNGRFYSVSYTGVVEAWHRDPDSGAYTSTAVAPRLAIKAGENPRKYLAAAPGGRLMVALKYPTMERHSYDGWTYSFKVHVLGDDGQWKETRDMGDLALFVGVNNSLCVSTRGRPEMEASCVYFIGDVVMDAWVYSLKDGTVKKMEALEQQQLYRRSLTRPVWIMPSVHA